ncbi:hypothetical protein K3N28_06025 [Glycomyces sp. TRM65418]|uniref:hypothetical protein n=1 Tax=Glycomyces sp. TRM65418 TaxID=2867006 RepID=UPI001CE5A041|nr:hypothetical protein [Glycomyces sp. TRM65418]MCC3762627.1 hypothetical protein [Glycomyces sp. TRM65418]QZD56665.1 hypothetical protein K3N28_05985 [Glycomyces sp. TRM65418]
MRNTDLLSRPGPHRLLQPERRDQGFATAFSVALLVALLAAVGLSIDGGGAAAAKARVATAAAESARAGADAIDVSYFRQSGIVRLDPPEAEAAARAWLTATGMDGTVTATGADVTVTAETTYDTQILSAVGFSAFTVTATATAEPDQGDTPAAFAGQPMQGRNGL